MVHWSPSGSKTEEAAPTTFIRAAMRLRCFAIVRPRDDQAGPSASPPSQDSTVEPALLANQGMDCGPEDDSDAS